MPNSLIPQDALAALWKMAQALWNNLPARKRIWLASIWWFFAGLVVMWISMLVTK